MGVCNAPPDVRRVDAGLCLELLVTESYKVGENRQRSLEIK